MDVILLEKIRNIGKLGEKVKVKAGFARNYLIPKGKAVTANVHNIAEFEKRRAELEKLANEKQQEAVARQKAINDLPPLTLCAKAGEEGKLFGSIGTKDIADAICKAGIDVEKRDVRLPEGTIRMLGEYDVSVELESDILATIKLNVVSEN